MKLFALSLIFALPTLADAGVEAVVDAHILPGYASFADATQDLAEVAQTCDSPDLKPAYHAAFDAWLAISHIQFGPVEENGRSLAIAYWPDPKDQTGRAVSRLIADNDPAVKDPAAFNEVSVAAQGFFALERLLFDTPEPTEYTCAFTRAIALHLASAAATLNDEWQGDLAGLLRNPGQDGSPWPSPAEATRVLYTSLTSGLEFIKDQRLGRPLGTFERPRPTRAEAYRSERSLRNVALGLSALRAMAVALADGDIPDTTAAFDRALASAQTLDDPALQGVADPGERFRIEALQQQVVGIQAAIATEIGAALGVQAGFNAMDGD